MTSLTWSSLRARPNFICIIRYVKKTFLQTSKVWKYPGSAAWYFVNIDKGISQKIRNESKGIRASMRPASVTVHDTTWNTSLFWSKQDQSYILPIKKKIRHEVGILEGDQIEMTIKLV